jgi:arginyl-tRNA synthetase
VLRRAEETFDLTPEIWSEELSEALTHPDELKILLTLGRYPHVVQEAARERAPHKLVFYLRELSKAYQSYYTRLKSEHDPILPQARDMTEENWKQTWAWSKTRARLAWIEAIRTVYASGLSLLGITAPERMNRVEEPKTEETDSA